MRPRRRTLPVATCLLGLSFGCASRQGAAEAQPSSDASDRVEESRSSSKDTESAVDTEAAEPFSECDDATFQASALASAVEAEVERCATVLDVNPSRIPLGCSARVLGNGSAVQIYAEQECGGDSCSGDVWIMSANSCGPVPLTTREGTFEASPDGRYVFVDAPVEGPLEATGPIVDIELHRVSLASGQSAFFAPCMSPVLSPGGRWILCRNRAADVLRVPLEGGEPEVVAISGAKHPRWVPYALSYPDPVVFEEPDQLTFSIEEDGLEPQARRIPWVEERGRNSR